MKQNKIDKIIEAKWFHIALIIVATIFILLGSIHSEVWFDEAYTIALVRHNFAEIISIDSRDVHPVLYYLLLKVVTMIFGNSIVVCRLFSMAAGIALGILGYTHIRKDFGAKIGVAFSFLVFFLPYMTVYGLEIRMYMWTILFVTLSAIYAYRTTKENKMKNWFLFAIFSLGAANCHYYGLATVAIINALLFLYIIFSKKIYQDNKNSKKSYLIHFAITALIEIVGYLPWLLVFLKQVKSVSQGYWIQMSLAETVIAPLGIQFNGRLNIPITVAYTVIMYAYLIYQIICAKKQKQKSGVAYFCLAIHFILYFSMILITVLVKPIMYHRYMLVTLGVFVFPFAYYLSYTPTKHQKIISSLVVIIILVLSIYNNSIVIKENYGANNGKEVEYIKQQCEEETIILYKDIFHATAIQVQMPEYNWYLYHIDPNHDVKPFENFSPPLKIIFEENFLENYYGRIIIIDHDELEFYKELANKYELTEIEKRYIRTNYRGFGYQIITVEK